MTEHLSHVEVEWLHAVSLLEAEVSVASSLAHHVHRSTLTVGNLLNLTDIFLVDEQAHALLTLVGDDFLGAQGLVADRQLRHVDFATALLNQLGEAVQVTGRTVVVNTYHWVLVVLHEGTNQVVGTLLHLWVGTLNGVQLDAVAVATCIYGRNRTTTETDAIVVTTYYDNLVALLWLTLLIVTLLAIAYATSEHDNLVVSIFLTILLVLEGKHRTSDKRLTKLVTEVGSTVGSLDKNLFWSLIEPLAHWHDVFPVTLHVALAVVVLQTRISGHVAGCTCDRP